VFIEFLDKKRLEVWTKLNEFKDSGVLGGGTALAMQLNHRVSYDFDIFTEGEISERLLLKLSKVFWEYKITPVVDTADELTVELSGEIKLTWLYFPFAKLDEAVKSNSLELFSVSDLLANKAYAIGRRKTWRDYADVYWALKNNIITLDNLVDIAKNKFKNVFSDKLFLEQLVYFDDVEDRVVDWIGEKVKNDEIKDFLRKTVEEKLNK
jgi:predicted nucleotidyltransferase component of viral defense system